MSSNNIVKNLNRDKLKHFIENSSYTQKEITEKMGVSRGYISHVLLGESISVPMYKLMCVILGVNEDYFIKDLEPVEENTDLLTAMYKELKEINYNLSELINSLK